MKHRMTLAILVALFATSLSAQHLIGTIALGTPVNRDGKFAVPVTIYTDAQSVSPQAFCFRLDFSSPVMSAVVTHAGVTASQPSVFEWQALSNPTTLNYLVVYDGSKVPLQNGGVSAITVAEIALTLPDTKPVTLTFDKSSLVMLCNQEGTFDATQENGRLSVQGVIVDPMTTPIYIPPIVVTPPLPIPTPQPIPSPAPRRRASGG